MKKTYNLVGFLLSIVTITISCCFSSNVFAGDWSGNMTGGVEMDCNFPQVYTDICGTIGGASWHVYSTKASSSNPRRYFDDGSSPGGDVLVGNVTSTTAKNNCKNDDYYVAFGWDGRLHNGWNGINVYVHWGPAQWNTGVIAQAWYNANGAVGCDDGCAALVNSMKNGTIANGQKITQYAAQYLHNLKSGSWNIPDTTGYFCASIKKQATLTAYAGVDGSYWSSGGSEGRTYLTSSGGTSTKESDGWSNSSTVSNGSDATVTTENFNPDGYSWGYWGSSCATSEQNGRKCTKKGLTANTKVYSYYYRNSFQGQASVAEGKNWSGTSNRALTGWVATDKDASVSVRCKNDGCDTNFWLQLRTVGGTGATKYRTGRSEDGGTTIAWSPSSTQWSSITPKSDAAPYSLLVGTSNDVGTYKKLLPGQEYCYYLKFYPYGSLSNSTSKTLSACAEAEVTTFYGKSAVSGATKKETIFVNEPAETDATERATISDCSPVNGCKIEFTHSMKTTDGGLGSSDYYIERTSNLTNTNSNRRIAEVTSATKVFSGPVNDPGKVVSTSEELTLYPGMMVCERLKFKPDNRPETINDENKWASVRMCVYALGNAQPSGDDAFLKLEVRNTNVNKYSSFQNTTNESPIYAKPDDNLQYRVTYNPVLQYTYYLVPRKTRINDGAVWPSSDLNFEKQLGQVFNDIKSGSLLNWNNAFGLRTINFATGSFNRTIPESGAIKLGDATQKTDINDHKVDRGEVGRSLNEEAKTNTADSNKTTPSQVTFTYENSTSVANVVTNAITRMAYVKVPYNFTTSIGVDFPGGDDEKFSSGETGSVNITIDVNPKGNSLTTNSSDEKYATKVSSPKLKIILYVPGSGTTKNGDSGYGNVDSDLCDRYGGSSICQTKNISVGTFNSAGNMNGKKESKSSSFYVPDLDAGTEVCVAAANYPSTSGADSNINASGDGKWNVSNSKCFKIYKKPSVQVWGGSVYSNDTLNVPYSAKRHVDGINSYSINSTNDYYVFGSWAELNLVTIKQNTGFGSGASMGFVSNDSGTLSPSYNSDNPSGINPGGSNESTLNFCNRSVLTFANTGSNISLTCSSATPGLGASGTTTAENNKGSLISRFVNVSDEEKENIKNIHYNTISSISAEGIEDAIDNSDPAKLVIKKGKTVVLDASKLTKKFVTIDKNIEYEDGYETLKDIPKLIIYADNILINCEVTRIDAVLIAENNTDTCNNSSDINSQANSNQLTINGSVITNVLKANRTFGAAKGTNSIIPAEIVNYDATLYLWGSNKADVTESGRLAETYVTEVSPRQ